MRDIVGSWYLLRNTIRKIENLESVTMIPNEKKIIAKIVGLLSLLRVNYKTAKTYVPSG